MDSGGQQGELSPLPPQSNYRPPQEEVSITDQNREKLVELLTAPARGGKVSFLASDSASEKPSPP